MSQQCLKDHCGSSAAPGSNYCLRHQQEVETTRKMYDENKGEADSADRQV